MLLALGAMVAFAGSRCAPPTAFVVRVYSEVGCDRGSVVAVVGGTSLAELRAKAPSSVSTQCGPDGYMGDFVVVPSASGQDAVIAAMQRDDGQSADACLDPAESARCIVAKRQLRFLEKTTTDMRVDLRLSCVGVMCPADQTCVKGSCAPVLPVCADESCFTPADAAPPPSPVLVAAGGNHSCAVKDGVASCWGHNNYGQLGDGTITDRNAPARVVGLPAGSITAISAGYVHSCAIVGGDAYCWGAGGAGQLGNGAGADSGAPVKVTGLPAGHVTDVAGGDTFTCAVAAGQVYCWGTNGIGQLGNGTTNASQVPVGVITGGGPLTGAVQITAGQDHACATTSSGVAYCWGHSDSGALGNASAGGSSSVAVPVQGLPSSAISITIAGWHACAITSDGASWCWGTGTSGELGNGQMMSGTTPVKVALAAGTTTSLAAGGGPTDGDATCAVTGGQVACWGNDQHGRLGDGMTVARASPISVALPASAVSVTGGLDHFCAALSTREVRCWGAGSFGQIGDGGGVERATPALVSGL